MVEDREMGEGRRTKGFMVCAAKMSMWDIIMGLVLKTVFLETFGKSLLVD